MNEGLILCRSVAQNTILSWINKISKVFVPEKLINDVSQDYIDKLAIKTPSVNQRVEYLSGGNQQKVVMAKWLVANADLLILLEPTEGIDVKARWEIYQMLNDLAEQGKGILIISSDLDEIVAISDKVLVMRNGEMVYSAQGEDIVYKEVFNEVVSGCEAT
jgi:ribose transport system ATP-binding protein